MQDSAERGELNFVAGKRPWKQETIIFIYNYNRAM